MSINRLRRYYLAGPMSGVDGHNFEKFDFFARELRAKGFRIVNPAEIARKLPGKPGDLPYHEYVKADIKEMMECSDIIMMPGWRGSRGAVKELELADFLQFRVWRIESDLSLSRMDYGDRSVG